MKLLWGWLTGLRPVVLALLVVGWVAKAAAGWALFGFSVVDEPAAGKVKLKRWFGRVTAVESDADRDGRPEARYEFSWRHPFRHAPEAPACAPLDTRAAFDWNGDGRWDTWRRVEGRDDEGRCMELWEADLDLDGKPDTQLRVERDSTPSARDQLRERRGF